MKGGFLATLSSEQLAAALSYCGEDTVGTQYPSELLREFAIGYRNRAITAEKKLEDLQAACVRDGYDPHYLANGVLTKRRSWRD